MLKAMATMPPPLQRVLERDLAAMRNSKSAAYAGQLFYLALPMEKSCIGMMA
jgi:hypothetical protein